MHRVAVIAFLVALVLVACASPLANLNHERTLTSAKVTLRWSDDDQHIEQRLARAIDLAQKELERFGALEHPVTVSVLADHDDLEAVTKRHGFGWLRAFSRFDTVWLQSPRTWPVQPRDIELAEWLTHELTHCVLFQHSATAANWETKAIPFWFREGMATVAAHQGYRYASLEDLASWQLQHPDFDVFTDGEALSRDAADQAYGLSHHAMAFMLRRYGDDALIDTMSNMKKGDVFDVAFGAALGISTEAFAREFTNYLRLRGYRGFGLPMRR